MKCIVPGNNIKIFGKAIHSLSKIGEEVYFEPLPDGLALRTVNSSRSAYACFVFAPSFFVQYDDGSKTVQGQGEESDQDEDDVIRCKVGVKSCLTVFKSLSSLEKTVDRCKISLDMDEARLIFQLYCKHGIVKTHNLGFIECETLQAVFSKDMTPNKLTAQSRLLGDAVVNFQTNQEEVTLCVNPEKVLLKNYVDDEPDPHKVIRTELSLDPAEFEDYQVGIDTDVTFCLKELRAILGFSESSNLPLSIHFENPGRPIVFCINSDSTFEANFVLATLADAGRSVSSSQQSSTQTSIRNHTTTRVTPHQPRSKLTARNTTGNTTGSTSRDATGAADTRNDVSRVQLPLDNNSSLYTMDNATSSTLQTDNAGQSTASLSTHAQIGSAAVNLMDHSSLPLTHDSTLLNMNNDDSSRVRNSNRQGGGSESGVDRNGRHDQTQQQQQVLNNSVLHDVSEEDEEEEEELVPGTPPAKKFKSLFFNISSQLSTQASQPLQTTAAANKPTVLAEDTDEED